MESSLREQLITEAEAYQRDGEALPLDLYSSLMAQGIDASLYNQIEDHDEGNSNEN